MQTYSDPNRKSDEYALPNIEVWYDSSDEIGREHGQHGYYWWSCFPGCMPDSEPMGPFNTELEAIEDAQDC
jgi:hypothetical protein